MFLLMCGLLSSAIYAYFNDTATSAGNTFTAGTLNLVPSTAGTGPAGKYTVTAGGDGLNGNVVFNKVAPGDNGSITWALTNSGDLNGTLTIASTVTFAQGSTNPPKAAAIAGNGGVDPGLGACVGVKLLRNGAYILGTASNYVPFSGLQAVLNAENQTLAASGTITYVLQWQIATDVKLAGPDGLFGTADDVLIDDNIIQADQATVDITFQLVQA